LAEPPSAGDLVGELARAEEGLLERGDDVFVMKICGQETLGLVHGGMVPTHPPDSRSYGHTQGER
jgi:hypothetical protein